MSSMSYPGRKTSSHVTTHCMQIHEPLGMPNDKTIIELEKTDLHSTVDNIFFKTFAQKI